MLVAHLVALGAHVEGDGVGPLAGDQVDVDRAAAGDGGEQQLDRGEVGVVAGADQGGRRRARWWPCSGPRRSWSGRCCAGSGRSSRRPCGPGLPDRGARAPPYCRRMRTVFRCDDPEVNPYRLLTAVVVPRPIAWVSVAGRRRGRQPGAALVLQRRLRLRPRSSRSPRSAPRTRWPTCAPPGSSWSTSPRDRCSSRSTAPAHRSARTSTRRPGSASGLSRATSCAPPRVSESPASIECALHSTLELGDSTLVLGRVLAITVRDDALVDGRPAMAALQPLSRLGGDEWGLPPEVIHIRRPTSPDDVA